MKKLLILGTVLALLAILAVPMAAFAADSAPVTVTGALVAATIEVTAPTFAGFGNFSHGDNYIASTNDGSVVITQNSQTPSGWTVTAKDLGGYGGYMWNVAVSAHLAAKLYISPDSWSTWNTADVGVSWTAGGLTGSMPTYLKQTVDNEAADTYSITITYTGQINF